MVTGRNDQGWVVCMYAENYIDMLTDFYLYIPNLVRDAKMM